MLKYFEVFEECPPYALCTSVPLSEGKGSENHCPVWGLTTSEDSRGRDNEPSVAGKLYSKLFQRLNSSSKATLSGTRADRSSPELTCPSAKGRRVSSQAGAGKPGAGPGSAPPGGPGGAPQSKSWAIPFTQWRRHIHTSEEPAGK